MIDGHFSIDVGDDWERHRENGSSAATLFRGNTKNSTLYINIAFNGIVESSQLKEFFNDNHAKFLTKALIEDTITMFPKMKVNIRKTAHRIMTISGIKAMQIDVCATCSFRSFSRDLFDRHTYLLFGDGRLYRVTLNADEPGADFRTRQLLNSIIPLVKPGFNLTPDSFGAFESMIHNGAPPPRHMKGSG